MSYGRAGSLLEDGRRRWLLSSEKLEQWDWFERFLEQNPDIEERWAQHKTYEILKNEA
jgi:hypothetical protein